MTRIVHSKNQAVSKYYEIIHYCNTAFTSGSMWKVSLDEACGIFCLLNSIIILNEITVYYNKPCNCWQLKVYFTSNVRVYCDTKKLFRYISFNNVRRNDFVIGEICYKLSSRVPIQTWPTKLFCNWNQNSFHEGSFIKLQYRWQDIRQNLVVLRYKKFLFFPITVTEICSFIRRLTTNLFYEGLIQP